MLWPGPHIKFLASASASTSHFLASALSSSFFGLINKLGLQLCQIPHIPTLRSLYRYVVILGKGSCSQGETGNQLVEAGQLLKANFTFDMTDRSRSLSAGPLDIQTSVVLGFLDRWELPDPHVTHQCSALHHYKCRNNVEVKT